MFSKAIIPAVVAALALPMSFAVPASATPLSVPQQAPIIQSTGNPLATQVHLRKRYSPNVRHWNRQHLRHWNRRAHGPRCLRRFGRCRHYYRGYYYATPWWRFSFPLIGGRVVISGSSRHAKHVRWCERKYRSYNRRTNTWIAYSGKVRVCISPYSR